MLYSIPLIALVLLGCIDESIANCGNTLDYSERIKCVSNVAVSLNDSTQCNYLEEGKSDCLANYQVQTEQFDCTSISDPYGRDYCLSKKSIAQESMDDCNQVIDEVYKEYCLNALSEPTEVEKEAH